MRRSKDHSVLRPPLNNIWSTRNWIDTFFHFTETLKKSSYLNLYADQIHLQNSHFDSFLKAISENVFKSSLKLPETKDFVHFHIFQNMFLHIANYNTSNLTFSQDRLTDHPIAFCREILCNINSLLFSPTSETSPDIYFFLSLNYLSSVFIQRELGVPI